MPGLRPARDVQDNLAEIFVRLHIPVGVRGVAEREDGVDHGAHTAIDQGRFELLLIVARDRNPVREGTRAHDRAEDLKSLDHEQTQIDLRLGAAHQPHLAQPAGDRQRFEIALQVWSADQFENDVHALPTRRLLHIGGEVFLLVVDRAGGTDLERLGALLVRTGGDPGLAAEQFRDLDRRDADTAPATVDKRPLARLEATQGFCT